MEDDFFQLVRLAERSLCRHPDTLAPVGGDGPPGHEAVRFATVSATAYPRGAVHDVSAEPAVGTDGRRYRMAVRFMGLTGAMGVLPPHYTSLVRSRQRLRDHALADFLDMFNHRMIGLFYRAWTKYRLPVQRECARGTDPMTALIQALTGQRAPQPYEPALYYAGHFARRVRSATALEQMIGDFVGHPTRVEMFAGQWLEIPASSRLQLGSGRRGRNHRLGHGVMPGRRAWDVQSRCRLHLGPLRPEEHEALLPGTAQYQALRSLVRAYCPEHIDIDIAFEITERAPQERRRLGAGVQCARNTWLQSGPATTRHARFSLTDN